MVADRERAKRGWRPFMPILAGATLRDRVLACFGAAAGIALIGLAGIVSEGPIASSAWIVAPIGASAVLLFAIPASPLAQPWPVIGGSVISAAVGLAVAAVVSSDALAAGVAVGLAIAAMSAARCLHPPGGAMALTTVLGGEAITDSGILFPLVPVGLDAIALVLVGWAFHRVVTGHSYPHVAPRASAEPATSERRSTLRVGFTDRDIDAVLDRIGDSFDIGREDLGAILHAVESQALHREFGDLTCGEIMSREVHTVKRDGGVGDAVRLLVDSGARLLPVVDHENRVVGGVGLRGLSDADSTVEDGMFDVPTVTAERLAIEIAEPLAAGNLQAVIVTDGNDQPRGLITPANLLAALTRRRTAN